MADNGTSNLMDKVVSLCKRRGFVFPGSEIYGGLQGFYDYGPLGVEMKNNLKKMWWKWMTVDHKDVVGIDGAIITHPKVWEASGHIKGFVDPLSECKKCHHRFKVDDLKTKNCPDCGGELTEPRNYNTLVQTELGVIEDDKTKTYLRGEACQTIYLNFKNVVNSMRVKLPFGICQIGKAFRNEVTPGNFLYRQREFEQWDLQWFTQPEDMDKWYEYWKNERMNWYKSIFTHPENLGFHQHEKLVFYAKKAFDIEYLKSPFGKEIEGIHWRSDWDLGRHGEFSRQDLKFEGIIPHIVETSGGVDRTFLFLIIDAYFEETEKGKERIILKLDPKIAPYKVAVFPLLANKPELIDKAKAIYDLDEIGTPWCITVDYDTLKDDAVTVRDRDTAKQERIGVGKLEEWIGEKLGY